ncbi:hypothetical protein ABC347_17060 [Sphingomonas sp. 1P06PA]|uniref:hypothetical protein n=1 Tax=Sphingomonas sp. 1P06PA TaxID=554121 RepID=UPI0039A4E528
MRPSRNSALGGVAALALIAALPAIGQEAPESLLPEGFGDPTPPATAPAPGAGDPAVQPAPGAPPLLTLAPPPPTDAEIALTDEEAAAKAEAEAEAARDMPEAIRRSPNRIGPLGTGGDGLGATAFGDADGRFLSALMRKVDAPIASRWASILLRRALMTAVETPRGVSAPDWVAERAWLLLRMGEADAARMMVDSVDVEDFTPKLLAVTTQVALANADPTALCPLTVTAESMSDEPAWPLARAMCAGLAGEPALASQLINRARRSRTAGGIDLLLAEKVVGAGANGRRAVNIEWDAVDQLTGWRFGVATAVGVPVPERLYASAGPHVRGWAARAPMLSPEDRVAPARVAATLGVISSAALVDLYGSVAERADPLQLAETDAGRLRAAYADDDPEARLRALRSLWTASDVPRERYAAQILTARAAAAIQPSADHADDAGMLVAAMMAAGRDLAAARWTAIVDDASGEAADRAWAMLAVGAVRPTGDLSQGRVSSFINDVGDERSHQAQLLVAALGGLGRISPTATAELATEAGAPIGAVNRWTRALEGAARARQPGTVALLAAIGLQSGSWAGIPAAHLYRITAALRAVGLEGEARMIAAEAIART